MTKHTDREPKMHTDRALPKWIQVEVNPRHRNLFLTITTPITEEHWLRLKKLIRGVCELDIAPECVEMVEHK